MDAAQTKEVASSPDLVRRIRDGDRIAEEEFVERYRRGIRRIIKEGVRNRAFVEDLCQETFKIALEKLRRGDVREPDKLSAFITSLARNIVIDHHRRTSRRDDRQVGIEAAEHLPDPAPSQLEMMLQKERAEIARQILSDLPRARDREVLVRFYLTEDDKDQICADLQLTSLQFNQVLFRALRRCKEVFQRRHGRSEATVEKKRRS